MRRLIGCGGSIDYAANVKPDFRLADGEAPVVMLEHLANIHGGLEVDTRRTLVLRSVSDCDLTSTGHAKGAEWFFEDVVTHNLAIEAAAKASLRGSAGEPGGQSVNSPLVFWMRRPSSADSGLIPA